MLMRGVLLEEPTQPEFSRISPHAPAIYFAEDDCTREYSLHGSSKLPFSLMSVLRLADTLWFWSGRRVPPWIALPSLVLLMAVSLVTRASTRSVVGIPIAYIKWSAKAT